MASVDVALSKDKLEELEGEIHLPDEESVGARAPEDVADGAAPVGLRGRETNAVALEHGVGPDEGLRPQARAHLGLVRFEVDQDVGDKLEGVASGIRNGTRAAKSCSSKTARWSTR